MSTSFQSLAAVGTEMSRFWQLVRGSEALEAHSASLETCARELLERCWDKVLPEGTERTTLGRSGFADLSIATGDFYHELMILAESIGESGDRDAQRELLLAISEAQPSLRVEALDAVAQAYIDEVDSEPLSYSRGLTWDLDRSQFRDPPETQWAEGLIDAAVESCPWSVVAWKALLKLNVLSYFRGDCYGLGVLAPRKDIAGRYEAERLSDYAAVLARFESNFPTALEHDRYRQLGVVARRVRALPAYPDWGLERDETIEEIKAQGEVFHMWGAALTEVDAAYDAFEADWEAVAADLARRARPHNQGR
jgi:hypothetical protein